MGKAWHAYLVKTKTHLARIQALNSILKIARELGGLTNTRIDSKCQIKFSFPNKILLLLLLRLKLHAEL